MTISISIINCEVFTLPDSTSDSLSKQFVRLVRSNVLLSNITVKPYRRGSKDQVCVSQELLDKSKDHKNNIHISNPANLELLISYFVKVKANFNLCLTNYAPFHGDVCGNGGIAPTFLTSALDASGQLDAPATLPPAKEPQVPIG
jgi:hypothetical protein